MGIYKVSVWSQLFFQPPVEDKDLTTPPGAPTKGDRYIVGTGASGAWSGKDDKITTYDGAAWGFVDPKEGMLLYVKDENKYYLYITSWAELSAAIATHAASHQNAGGDEISVAALSGLLADDQHVLDAEVVTAAKTVKLDDFTAPDDNTDLDASITKHGLLKKLSNNALHVLNGVGSWITALFNVVEDTTPQLGGDLDLNGKNIDFPTTPNISDCLDEDNMVSDSATKLATQQSIKAYADTKLANVVEDTTPQLGGTLDCQNKDVDNIKTATFNGEYDAGNSGSGAKTINFNNGQNQKVTLDGDCTFAFTAPPGPAHCQLRMIQDGTGSRDPSWPAANFTWIDGTEPTWATGAGEVSIVNLWWDGAGWWGAGMKFA